MASGQFSQNVMVVLRRRGLDLQREVLIDLMRHCFPNETYKPQPCAKINLSASRYRRMSHSHESF